MIKHMTLRIFNHRIFSYSLGAHLSQLSRRVLVASGLASRVDSRVERWLSSLTMRLRAVEEAEPVQPVDETRLLGPREAEARTGPREAVAGKSRPVVVVGPGDDRR